MAKILLVEDDTNLSEIYQARMEAEGYQVVAASDGESALALAAQEKPDLIISDVMMPKISGFEMLDILRNTEGLKDTPVIMLTALGQADDKDRADSLGADRYLVKSQVTLEDIVNAAHSILEGDPAPQMTQPSQSQAMTPEPEAAQSVQTTAQPVATDDNASNDTSTPVIPLAVAPSSTPTPPATTNPADGDAPATENFPSAGSQPARPISPTNVTAKNDGFEHRPIAPVRVPAANNAPIGRTARSQTTPPIDTTSSSPAVAPVNTPTDTAAIDANIVATAIDKIASRAPQPSAAPVQTAPIAVPTPEDTSGSTDSTANHGQILPTSVSSIKPDDGRPLKKVISPIERPPETSLEELLAREQASIQDTEDKLAEKPQQTSKPSDDTPFDPNSIAL